MCKSQGFAGEIGTGFWEGKGLTRRAVRQGNGPQNYTTFSRKALGFTKRARPFETLSFSLATHLCRPAEIQGLPTVVEWYSSIPHGKALSSCSVWPSLRRRL